MVTPSIEYLRVEGIHSVIVAATEGKSLKEAGNSIAQVEMEKT